MSKCLISIFLQCVIVLWTINESMAWNDKKTHPLLGDYASEVSILGKNNEIFLKNLGFPDGLKQDLESGGEKKKIFEWIRLGERLEDAGSYIEMLSNKARFNNHFHTATKQMLDNDWSQAGLDDWTFPIHSTGESSLLWAQDRQNQKRFVGSDHTWQQARDDYYAALTGTSEEVRSEKFAAMFRTLGHQIHLIQDASVPSHTRNDAHAENSWPKVLKTFRFGLEWWAQVHLKDNIAKLKQFAPESSIPTVTVDLLTSIPASHKSIGLHSPIYRLIDTDRYMVDSGPLSLNDTAQGLAEFSNANFFTLDTMFPYDDPYVEVSTNHKFKFPGKDSTNLADYINGSLRPVTVQDLEGQDHSGVWISRTSGNGNLTDKTKGLRKQN